MRLALFAAALVATPALAAPQPPLGQETVIAFAGNGGLRDWQRGGRASDVLYVRDRTERWYKVTLTGRCRFDRALDTLSYTTDPLGTFDRFSQVRVASRPQQSCGVKSIQTSLPPAGHPGHRPKA